MSAKDFHYKVPKKVLEELKALAEKHQKTSKENCWDVVPFDPNFEIPVFLDNYSSSEKDPMKLRYFLWDYRPRKKYVIQNPEQNRREFRILCCYASDSVYEKNKDTTLIGWDAWDAVDGLE